MRTTKLAGAAVVAATALVLSACGGSGDQGGDVPSADLSGQTLEVAGVWSGDEQAAFEEVLALFEERTGAEVTYTSATDDLPTVLQTRVDGKTPPNVAVLPQPGLITQFARAGALQPLSAETQDVLNENYVEMWSDLGSVDDTPYGVFFKTANKSTVWYNTALFDEAGVTPPATMADLLASAETLSDNGIAPFSVGGADGWVLTDWFENIYLQTAGPEMYDKLSRHEIPWTDPSVREALTVLGEVLKPEFLDGGSRGALQTEFPTSVSNVFGNEPKAAMVYEGDFVAGVITASTSAQLGDDARFFPFPRIDGADPSVVVGGDAAVAFTADAATEELMKFLASPEAAEVWAARGGFLSPNKGLDVGAYPDELTRELAQQLLDAGENLRFDMSDLAPSAFGATKGSGMWKDLQDFVADPGDIEGAMRNLENNAAKAFQE
ncbi:carbohydrate ABC transporter substrate-binding protein, CUT1 family [Amycolatopsis marina]|uniref:Carbohydrate ABC transporter substrate-binding protein, CUT1 family n=1 Tax=Amycolatopsis marina TaxID=490629 RepID=A0A1I1AR32_9PSEU|nr:ABC transporter substrate-binding protein [Amycolatopsis marina]SFB40484.1 carbohydrate ABC transporter substrate-binding protein, CUT1 family [Amycolatopsis marina]